MRVHSIWKDKYVDRKLRSAKYLGCIRDFEWRVGFRAYFEKSLKEGLSISLVELKVVIIVEMTKENIESDSKSIGGDVIRGVGNLT